jgi:hypothetical protein
MLVFHVSHTTWLHAVVMQSKTALESEVESLRRHVDQVNTEQRRGSMLVSVADRSSGTRSTLSGGPIPASIASQQHHSDRLYADLRVLVAVVDRECSVACPKLFPTLSQLKRVVGEVAADRNGAIQRESDLLDTLTTLVHHRGAAADVQAVRALRAK